MRKAFLEWMNSDNVIKLDDNLYSCQCTVWVARFTLFRLYRYFIKEYWIHENR